MGTPKFTPGPWSACKNGECGCGFIWDATDNVHVASAHDNSALGADWYGADVAVRGEERAANARLIAAAPEMYDALKALLPEGWGDDDTMDHVPGVKLARAALAKAGGSDV